MSDRDVLDSWKQISGYLRRSVKTCQRWESERGLPIHRLADSPRSGVFAYPDELDAWMRDSLRPKPSPPVSGFRFRNHRLRILIIAIALIAGSISGFLLWRRFGSSADGVPGGRPPRVAVLHFENLTGNENMDAWRIALPDLITTDIEQSPAVHSISRARILTILDNLNLENTGQYTHRDLVRIAAACSADYIAYGSLFPGGEDFVINFRIHDSGTGETLKSARFPCRSEREIIPLVDDLSRLIKRELRLPPPAIAADIDEDASRIRSPSPEAVKYYSLGTRAYLTADWDGAVLLLRKAVEEDPGLAMAYRHLAAIYINRGQREKHRACWDKITPLLDRVSERERRLLTGEKAWGQENDLAGGAGILKALVAEYPDDNAGFRNLGVIYKLLGDAQNAVRFSEQAWEIYPESVLDLCNLATCLIQSREYDEAERVLTGFIHKYPDRPNPRYYLVTLQVRRGEFDRALREWDTIFQIAPQRFNYARRRGEILFLQGEHTGAEGQFRTLLGSDNPAYRRAGRLHLARLHVYKGKIPPALELLKNQIEEDVAEGNRFNEIQDRTELGRTHLIRGDAAAAVHELETARRTAGDDPGAFGSLEIITLLRLGQAWIAAGSLDKARQTAGRMARLMNREPRTQYRRIHPLLLGRIELAAGNPAAAVERLEAAESMSLPYPSWPLPMAEFLEPLAVAYARANRLPEAEAVHEEIQALAEDRLIWSDIHVKNYYRLGRIYQRRGARGPARKMFQTFLDIRRHADPVPAEAAEARTRRDELRGRVKKRK